MYQFVCDGKCRSVYVLERTTWILFSFPHVGFLRVGGLGLYPRSHLASLASPFS